MPITLASRAWALLSRKAAPTAPQATIKISPRTAIGFRLSFGWTPAKALRRAARSRLHRRSWWYPFRRRSRRGPVTTPPPSYYDAQLRRRRPIGSRAQHGLQQPHRAILVQRSVAVPALGRLDAGRAPRLALAGRDGLAGGRQPLLAGGVPALGEPRAAGVPVVDEDRRAPGVLVQRGGDPADVPAVAGREQRQQADCGVLGGVRCAGNVGPLQPDGRQQVGAHRVPH